ncbi:MAG: hypothetical protein IJS96_00380 [Schwartzia sp.]|nr:hypothetical protein [Schwartzia sp. (in: firmicutes)]
MNESMGAGGLADSFNDLTFDDKKVYITSCKKLPDFTGKEIYLLETNIGAPGDNGKDKAEYGSQLLISQEEIDKEFGITGKDLEGWKEVEIR